MLRIIILIIFSLGIYLSSYGQAAIDQSSEIMVISTSDGNKIMLRWIPSDYKTWELGNSQGYEIKRYTISQDGERKSDLEIFQSGVVLEGGLFPLTSNQWDAQFPNNNFGQLGKNVLYSEGTAIPANPNLADAVNQQEEKESRHLFGSYAADQDFAVAKGLALGYEDHTALDGHEYNYRVKILGNDHLSASTVASLDGDYVLPSPTELSGMGEDQKAILQWNNKDNADYYSNFVIEKSTDGVNFQSATDLPYLYLSDESEDTRFASFTDSLSDNTTTFTYRVRGKSPFGILSPPSETVEVKGRPGRIANFQPKFRYIQEKPHRNALVWSTMIPDDILSQIAGFNIWRSEKPREGYIKLNPELRPAHVKSFSDGDFIPSAYYRLEVIDVNDHSYLSSPELFQRQDTIPPIIPTGLSGEFVTHNTLVLTWNKNPEDDLGGYRLFSANNRTSEYGLISERQIESETFVYEIDPEFMVDSIFLKISANDEHDNYSEFSAVLALARPDVIPPSRPVLYKANPTPSGIEIGWGFSGSDDVARHELQRKNINLTNWETVLTVTPGEEENYQGGIGDNSSETNFLDETMLEPGTYQYRLTAFDNFGNGSASTLINIRPYTSGVRGNIEGVNLLPRCVAPIEVENQEGYDALEAYILEYETQGTRNLDLLDQIFLYNIITSAEWEAFKLPDANLEDIYQTLQLRKINLWSESLIAQVDISWEYTPTGVRDYQIFRSTAGSDMMLYETVSTNELTDLIFEDTDVKAGHRYFYQIMARHHGGGFSEMSEVKMVRVPVL